MCNCVEENFQCTQCGEWFTEPLAAGVEKRVNCDSCGAQLIVNLSVEVEVEIADDE